MRNIWVHTRANLLICQLRPQGVGGLAEGRMAEGLMASTIFVRSYFLTVIFFHYFFCWLPNCPYIHPHLYILYKIDCTQRMWILQCTKTLLAFAPLSRKLFSTPHIHMGCSYALKSAQITNYTWNCTQYKNNLSSKFRNWRGIKINYFTSLFDDLKLKIMNIYLFKAHAMYPDLLWSDPFPPCDIGWWISSNWPPGRY